MSTNRNATAVLDDNLLADFLDWCDGQTASQEGIHSSPHELTKRFVREYRDSEKAKLHCRMLEQFLVDSLPISRAASDAVFDWIHDEGSLNAPSAFGEPLPRTFADYELLQLVGRGGMGVVYKARQISLNRIVAVKMLPPGLLRPDAAARLVKEARLVGSLNHPSIVAVYDAGEYDCQPFFAMEYVEGNTLADRLAQAPLSEQEAVWTIDRVSEAVEYAHENSVLHRDLKPTNVLVDANKRFRVADFGLARRVDASLDEKGIAGTPSYMAPEQAVGGAVDRRVDVYGIGAMLYELLSGRPPHVGNSPLETLRLVTSEEPVELRMLRPGISRDLETVCHKCLNKNPTDRYPSVTALRDELARIARHEPVLARPIGRGRRLVRWAQRHPAVATTGLVSCFSAVALILIGTFALHRTNEALGRALAADQEKGRALKRAVEAEAYQRKLAGALRVAKDKSDAALYRSQISRIDQLRTSGETLTAQRLLQECDTDAEAGVELSFLKRSLFPEEVTLADNRIVDAVWAPDGKFLYTISGDGHISTWSSDGTLIQKSQQQHIPQLIAIDREGKHIATVDDGAMISLLDARTLTIARTIPIHWRLRSVAWHPDRDWLVGLSDDGELVCVQPFHNRTIAVRVNGKAASCVSVSPDGQLVAVTLDDGGIAAGRWQTLMEDGTSATNVVEFAVFSEASDWVHDLSWNHSGNLLAVLSANRGVEFWSRSGRGMAQEVSVDIPKRGHGEWSIDCEWLADDLLVAHSDGRMIAVDPNSGNVRWEQPTPFLAGVRVQPNETRWLALCKDRMDSTAMLVNLQHTCIGRKVVDTDVPIRSIAASNTTGEFATRNVDGELTLYSVEDGFIHSIVESELGASALSISPQNDLLLATRGSEIVTLQLADLREAERAGHHSATIWTVESSPGGETFLSGDTKGQLNIYQTSPLRLLNSFQGLGGDIRAAAFSDDGTTFAVANENHVLRLIDVEGETLQSWQHSSSSVNAIEYAEGSFFVADSAGVISRLHPDDRNLLRWNAHEGPVWSLVRIGPRLISGGQDGNLVVWTLSGDYLMTLGHVGQAVWSIAYDAERGRLFAATAGGNVHIWSHPVSTSQ